MQSLHERQVAIKFIKDLFQTELAKSLNLLRVSAPLFVRHDSGLNDNLTGVEKPVSFHLEDSGLVVEVVQSLAKWKRLALLRYGLEAGSGLYTDMNAIRPFERMDEIHSIYVDQWDWEFRITEGERNEATLRSVVDKIYTVFLACQEAVSTRYAGYERKLPAKIAFIDAEELLQAYPELDAKGREDAICRKHGAVFLMRIGKRLSNGQPHDHRAPDYDDWSLNGDILVWNSILGHAFELSSMGVRVTAKEMQEQLAESNCDGRALLPYHQMVLDGRLPPCIGGGIGQSRICMFFLDLQHIGEVQASVWTEEIEANCAKKGIFLL